MNFTIRQDQFSEAFIKNFITFTLGVIINYINGTFVYTFFKSELFYQDPRYILYIHLVINDMIMLSVSVALQILSYTVPFMDMSLCCLLLLIIGTTNRNSPLNLAGMALERYIAVCKPLHHSQICTVRRTYILICLIWGVAVIPGLTDIIILLAIRPLTIFSSAAMCYAFGVFSSPYHKAKTTAVQVINLSFVFLTLIVTYFKVLYAAKAATTDQASARKARNTILLHGIQLLIFMLSYLTPLTNMVLMKYFPNNRNTILFSNFLFTNILPRLLSPLIYGVRDQNFARYLRVYFSSKLCAAQIRPTQAHVNSKRLVGVGKASQSG